MKIAVASILTHVDVFGPTDRLGIWLEGCPRRCPGCESPRLQTQNHFFELDDFLQRIQALIKANKIGKVVISGGEPFGQEEALLCLLRCIRNTMAEIGINTPDVLVYTGYKIEEIKRFSKGQEILSLIDVLIDGEYIAEKNDGKPLRGSSNQRIIFLNPSKETEYAPYLRGVRKFCIVFEEHLGFVYVGLLPNTKINHKES